MKRLIYISRPIPDKGLDLLKKAGYQLRLGQTHIHDKRELLSGVRGACAILSMLTDRIDAEVMDVAGNQLKAIANYAVGYDNIDLAAARARQVKVTNTPVPELTDAVAQHTVALILAACRGLRDADQFTRQNKYHGWDPLLFIGKDVRTLTFGLIGLGRIGKKVANIMRRGFGTKVIYYDTRRDPHSEHELSMRRVSLSKLLATSDIVSLHVPLLPSTHHLINRKVLRSMKNDALLVNTSRGLVVDEEAVVHALKIGKLSGYATDVFECEPRLACSPSVARRLLRLPNVMFTPHIGSATRAAREAMALAAAQSIIDVLAGKKTRYIVPST